MGIQLPLLLNTSGGTLAPSPVATISLSEESPRVIKRFGPSNLIVDQVPDFVNKDHDTFRRFVEAYYEWLEQYQNAFGIIDAFTEHSDIDQSIGLFIDDFRAMYLVNFPSRLAFDTSGKIVNEANFLKNARRFYGSKGTEKAFRFLFRLIYNTSMEFKYPSRDILRCSAGEWTEKKSVKTTSTGGTANFGMVGNQIYQIDDVSGKVLSYATVSDVIQYSVRHYSVTEIFIKDLFGTFSPNKTIYVGTTSGTLSENVFPVLSDVIIDDSGLGYRIGDAVGITNVGEGIGMSLSIDAIGSEGEVKRIRVNDSGIGYSSPTLSVLSSGGNGKARIRAVIGGVTSYPGYYSSNKSRLSSTGRLFDGNYYQDYSYVLRSEISLTRYKELYRKLVHPAGFKMFGEILLKRNIIDSLPFHSEMQRYEVPYIGHYTPYRMGTTADLYSKYPNGFNPRGNTYSDSQNYGLTGGKLFIKPRVLGTSFDSSFSWTTIGASGSTGGGITGMVFEFENLNSGGTYAAILLKKIDFNISVPAVTGAGFVEGSTMFMYSPSLLVGFTATIDRIRYGIGIVQEYGSITHDAQGLALGSTNTVEGYIEARGLSYSYWSIFHHPNTRSIKGLTGVLNGVCGPGASFGAIALNPFFRMPIGYHFHSNANGTPYQGTTGTNNEYGLIEGTNLTSPNY
jgi:hypothetical protein